MSSKLESFKLTEAKQRIVLFSLLSILLTGALVGLSTTYPLYQSIRTHIEEINLASAAARAASIDNHFQRYHSLAKQINSRTEIRKRLEDYIEHARSLEDIRAFSTPRLEEPAQQIPDLAALIRITTQGERIAAVGDLASAVPTQEYSDQGTTLVTLNDGQPHDLIRVTSVIQNAAGQPIGLDILYFRLDPLTSFLDNFNNFKEQVRLYIVKADCQRAITYTPELDTAVVVDTPQAVSQQKIALDARSIQPAHDQDGQAISLIYIPFNSLHWGLLIEVNDDIFYKKAYKDLALSILSIVVMLILGAIITHYAVHPLITKIVSQASVLEKNALQLRLAASVFQHTQEAIAITSPTFDFIQANKGFVHTFGLDTSPTNQQNLFDLLSSQSSQTRADIHNNIATALAEQEFWQGELSYSKKTPLGDTPLLSLQSISVVKDDQGQTAYLIHIFKDITERKAVEKKMEFMAHYDSLTGLPNRSAIMVRIDEEIRSGSPFAILFIDLDRFKRVNDQYGHPHGDELLTKVAKRIQRCIRSTDVVGRLGGDEFIAIIKQLDKLEYAESIAKAITLSIQQSFRLGDTDVQVEIGSSVGIAHWPENGNSMHDLIDAADAAMYRAKNKGGNQFSL